MRPVASMHSLQQAHEHFAGDILGSDLIVQPVPGEAENFRVVTVMD